MPAYLSGFLKGSSGKIQTLATGLSSNTYYCRNSFGIEIYSGLPKRLDDVIRRRKYFPPPTCVNLGPNGEWFVRFSGAHWCSDGMTDSCRERIGKLKEEGFQICEILFGCNDAWMIRYTR